MTEGERATGTPNTIYDLASVLFYALQGGASYDIYIEDAERASDRELADFFRQVRDEDSNRADRAQQLLAERTPTTARTERATTGAPPRPEPSDDLPGTEPISEEAPPGDVWRETTTARTPEEDLAPPGEVPSDVPRTGEMPPRAQEAPPPRTEPASAPPRLGDVPPRRTEEAPRPSSTGEPPLPEEQEMARRQAERNREEDKGLIEEIKDAILGKEEQGREGTDRPPRG